MNLTIIVELWETMLAHLAPHEVKNLASEVIEILIAHDIDPDKIRKLFEHSAEICDALDAYVGDDGWADPFDVDELDIIMYDDDEDNDDQW